MVTEDKETLRFIYHLIRSDPGQCHWFRIYVGEWHLLYHTVKAINNVVRGGAGPRRASEGADQPRYVEGAGQRRAMGEADQRRFVEGGRKMERRRPRGQLLIVVLAGSLRSETAGGWWGGNQIRDQISPGAILAAAIEMAPQSADRSIQLGFGLKITIPSAAARRERIWHRKQAKTTAMISRFD